MSKVGLVLVLCVETLIGLWNIEVYAACCEKASVRWVTAFGAGRIAGGWIMPHDIHDASDCRKQLNNGH